MNEKELKEKIEKERKARKGCLAVMTVASSFLFLVAIICAFGAFVSEKHLSAAFFSLLFSTLTAVLFIPALRSYRTWKNIAKNFSCVSDLPELEELFEKMKKLEALEEEKFQTTNRVSTLEKILKYKIKLAKIQN
jgi:hypothetical protein